MTLTLKWRSGLQVSICPRFYEKNSFSVTKGRVQNCKTETHSLTLNLESMTLTPKQKIIMQDIYSAILHVKFGSFAPMRKTSESSWKNNRKWVNFIEKKSWKKIYCYGIKINLFPSTLYLIHYTVWSFIHLHQQEKFQKYGRRKLSFAIANSQ